MSLFSPVRPFPAGLGPGWIAAARIDPLDGRPAHALEEWAGLVPREQEYASAASPRRAREFVAGRAALRRALRATGAPRSDWRRPSLPGEQGRPSMPSGWTGSITHKAGWAFAAAAPSHVGSHAGTIGLDSEVFGTRERLSIAARVLRPAELTRWRAAGADWPSLLRSFSVKEAIYKALHPWVPRYIGFHEAEVQADGSISMHLDGGEGDFVFESVVESDADRLLSFVRVRPT